MSLPVTLHHQKIYETYHQLYHIPSHHWFLSPMSHWLNQAEEECLPIICHLYFDIRWHPFHLKELGSDGNAKYQLRGMIC